MGEARVAHIVRTTKETDIDLTLDLDGTGKADVQTGVPFFDHMMNAFARHGLFDLTLRCDGDIEVDAHHTVEDCGIVLGQAFAQALGDKRGITRYGQRLLPMDETLVMAAVDISGRGACYPDLRIPSESVGNFDTELGVEFFIALAANAGVTLHVRQICGANSHHILEAAFKAVGKAMCEACSMNPRTAGELPTTKGAL